MTNTTIREALTFASNQLAVYDSARLDCEILLSSAMNKQREFMYSHPEKLLNPSELVNFNSLIMKRLTGHPVAYLTGRKEFWSLEINVNSSTLIPRPETELLVETALKNTKTKGSQHILDLGTGSGAIAIALSTENPLNTITATDICNNALQTATHNALKYNLKNISFLQSNWFNEIGQQKFDLILCNPPYIQSYDPRLTNSTLLYEPRIALDGGESGLDAFHQIIPTALKHLNSNGKLLLEHGYTQGESLKNLLNVFGYTNVQTFLDFSGYERVTVANYS